MRVIDLHCGGVRKSKKSPRRGALASLARLGPGLITGVADDDPSGIATYSQAGAQLGLNTLWTMPLSYPLMSAIQSICARIGRVTGHGLAFNLKQAFPPWVVYASVVLLLIANVFNIAADVAAMGEALGGSIWANRHLATVLLVAASLSLQVFVPYHRYVKVLRWLTLSLLAYAAVLFTIHVPWDEVLLRTLRPKLSLNASTATVVVGIFGTTISPYLFFWQSSEEIEDMRLQKSKPLLVDHSAAAGELRRIRWDTWGGMLFSNLVAYIVILTTALTLHPSGITDVQTAVQAAQALRPLAGDLAFYLFAVGIIGVGMLAVPVLAGSAGYALAETMGWRWGLEVSARQAGRFYGIIVISMLVALGLGFTRINPIKALFYSAVINGVVAVPLIVLILLLAARTSVLGPYRARGMLLGLGWMAAAVMALSVAGMLIPSP
jgi:NRAMP (natural resistance-associated macrophage protein)-like metal ion transporter